MLEATVSSVGTVGTKKKRKSTDNTTSLDFVDTSATVSSEPKKRKQSHAEAEFASTADSDPLIAFMQANADKQDERVQKQDKRMDQFAAACTTMANALSTRLAPQQAQPQHAPASATLDNIAHMSTTDLVQVARQEGRCHSVIAALQEGDFVGSDFRRGRETQSKLLAVPGQRVVSYEAERFMDALVVFNEALESRPAE